MRKYSLKLLGFECVIWNTCDVRTFVAFILQRYVSTPAQTWCRRYASALLVIQGWTIIDFVIEFFGFFERLSMELSR